MQAITKKEQDFSKWYQDLIKAADLAEHSPVRGCMIIKPYGYAIWENMQKYLDDRIKKTGHENAYFPLLIPLSFLQKEAEHVKGFAKECAIVTHYRLEADENNTLKPAESAKLEEPMIIRPTSEAIIGDAMSRWVQSYKDLPVLLNQWCNVFRWEMRTRLFLRTSEFLWQEGHTAHANAQEAMDETLKMLNEYVDFIQNVLAIPVVKGEKTQTERFPGAINTYTFEAMMQDGKALQCGTSHFMGQNFSKAYEIKFLNKNQTLEYAYTTSWGCTTRFIGALLMVHGDDDGIVLPVRIAPHHVVIIPIIKNDSDSKEILNYCQDLKESLESIYYFNSNIRVKIDNSDNSSADKFWLAVKKGYPIRIEIGLRDIQDGSFMLSKRTLAPKDKIKMKKDELTSSITQMLDSMHLEMYNKAKNYMDKKSLKANNLEDFIKYFKNEENLFVYAFFAKESEILEDANELFKELKITPRCIVFDNQEEGKCIFSNTLTKNLVVFAKSY